jgi:hypothetical protein
LGESKRNRVAQAEDGKEIDNELHLPSKRKDHSKIRLDHLPSAYHHNSFDQVSKQGACRAVRIRADFATIFSRIESLRDWPHTTLHPLEVAFAGFYHDPTEEDPATVACSSCEVVWWPRSQPVGRYSKNEAQTILLDYHVNNCLWADMLQNAMLFNLLLHHNYSQALYSTSSISAP